MYLYYIFGLENNLPLFSQLKNYKFNTSHHVRESQQNVTLNVNIRTEGGKKLNEERKYLTKFSKSLEPRSC